MSTESDPLTERMAGVSAHGYKHFDVPYMTEIAPNLWQGGCRDGLVLPEFIQHVVSLYPWESYRTKAEISSRLELWTFDAVGQGTEVFELAAAWVSAVRKQGPVLVNCQAGLNRSSVVTALTLMKDEGLTGPEAIELIRAKRSPACLCNPAFEAFVRDYAAG